MYPAPTQYHLPPSPATTRRSSSLRFSSTTHQWTQLEPSPLRTHTHASSNTHTLLRPLFHRVDLRRRKDGKKREEKKTTIGTVVGLDLVESSRRVSFSLSLSLSLPLLYRLRHPVHVGFEERRVAATHTVRYPHTHTVCIQQTSSVCVWCGGGVCTGTLSRSLQSSVGHRPERKSLSLAPSG